MNINMNIAKAGHAHTLIVIYTVIYISSDLHIPRCALHVEYSSIMHAANTSSSRVVAAILTANYVAMI